MQRLKLTFEGVVAGPGRLVGVRHEGLQRSAGAKDRCRQAS
jgi:hypothetical protein